MADFFQLDFRNLGPLKEGRLKLRDFNLVCGMNNSGKTYLAYLLFGVLKMLLGLRGEFIEMFDTQKDFEEEEREWLKSGSVRIPEGRLTRLFEEKVNAVNDQTEYHMKNLEDAAFLANIFNSNVQLFQELSIVSSQITIPPFNSLRNEEYIPKIPGLVLEWNDKEFVVEKSKSCFNDNNSISIAQLFSSYFLEALDGIWPRPYLFSTERSSIILFLKELDRNRSNLIDSLQRLENMRKPNKDIARLLTENSSRFSEPTAVNIERIRDITDRLNKGHTGILWREYGEELQKRFEELNDGFTYSWDEESQQFHYIRHQEGESIQVPLHAASSMSRELFDLYYYLRLQAAPGDIIIIDEPEAYLHPQKQMQLTRLLAFLSTRRIRILVTTHSDFIVREVNNLILANELQSKEFYSNEGEWLNRENVSCSETILDEQCREFMLEQKTVYRHGAAIERIDNAINEQASVTARLYDDLQEIDRNA